MEKIYLSELLDAVEGELLGRGSEQRESGAGSDREYESCEKTDGAAAVPKAASASHTDTALSGAAPVSNTGPAASKTVPILHTGTALSGAAPVSNTGSAVPKAASASHTDTALSGEASVLETEILSVVTDSRRIEEGCVFFALSGEKFDGHDYVEASLKKGAAGCVISRRPKDGDMLPGKFYVLVPDTRRALGDLAHYYRRKMGVTVVGITGSVGKTTCREMVQAVLSRRFRVHATEGNFNNDIGLPMTVFGLSGEDQVMVLEMGMNHLGEIRRLSQIAEPDIAVITNVGTAHIGNLGSRENIFFAKREIFEGLKEGGRAILCGDDDFLPRIAEDPELSEKFGIYFAGRDPECDYCAGDVRVEAGEEGLVTRCRIRMPARSGQNMMEKGLLCGKNKFRRREEEKDPSSGQSGRRMTEETPDRKEAVSAEAEAEESAVREEKGLVLEVRIPAAGEHLVYPALFAAAAGDLLGMTPQQICEGIGDFRGQRMPCERIGEIYLFDDTYNASLDSMRSSLQVLSSLGKCSPGVKTAAVLGDMFEQGNFAPQLHREVGEAAAAAGINTLITVGPLSAGTAAAAREGGVPDVRSFPDRISAEDAVRELAAPGTAVLFKASHGMALGRLAEIFREAAEEGCHR